MTLTTFPENTEKWLQFLEITDLPQAQEYLAAHPKVVSPAGDVGHDFDGPVGYCCLGVVCKMMPDGGQFLIPKDLQLMPAAAVRWLGLTEQYESAYYGTFEGAARNVDTFDIHVDYPWDEYVWRGHEQNLRVLVTASALNDAGLSFKQIAQMIRYFGIEKVA